MTAAVPAQFYFVSNRNINIGSTLGLSIAFEKGIPVHVPRPLHALVMERGCLPCDTGGKVLDSPEAASQVGSDEPKLLLAPEDPAERADKITAVMKALVERNVPTDFTGGGVPSHIAIGSALGWKVDPKEVRPLWNKLKPELLGSVKE